MAQANPAATDAATELQLTIDGVKQRTGVTCEVVGIATCDSVRVIWLMSPRFSPPPPSYPSHLSTIALAVQLLVICC